MNALLEPPLTVHTARRFTAVEYREMARHGFFDTQRVELIGGEVLVMPHQSNLHAVGIALLGQALSRLYGPNHWVRIQMSLDLSPLSIPDPDLAVIAGSIESNIGKNTNPTTALLVVEVSETTLLTDRARKASLYAAAGIEDYWILNVLDKQIEVRRNPQADGTLEFGYGYSTLTTFKAGRSIAPLFGPPGTIAVQDVLPDL